MNPQQNNAPSPPPGQVSRLAVLIGILSALLLGFLSPEGVEFTNDGAVYLEGAQSLALGQGYVSGRHAGQPPITLYPPGQSLVLSLVWFASPGFPANEGWLSGLMILLAGAAAGLGAAHLLREGVPLAITALGTVAVTLSWRWYMPIFELCSDPGFCALIFALAAIWRSGLSEPLRWLAVGIGLGAACWWRLAAIGFIVPVLMAAAWQLRSRRVLPLALCGIPILAGLLTVVRSGAGGFYVAQSLAGAKSSTEVLATRLQAAVFTLKGAPFWDMIFPLAVRLPEIGARYGASAEQAICIAVWLMFLAVLGMILAGAWSRRREGWNQFLGLVVGAYTGQVLSSGAILTEHARYYFAILPILVVWAWRGYVLLAHKLPLGSIARPAAICAMAGLVAGNAFVLRSSRLDLMHPRTLAELREVADWTRANTPTNATIAVHTWLPGLRFSAWSDRMLVGDYLGNVSSSMDHVAHSSQGFVAADYLLANDHQTRTNLPPGLLTQAKVSSSGHYRLYRVDPVLEAQYRQIAGIPMPTPNTQDARRPR